ncbi:MAG TPA: R3H domain-containing nucleic acid-binding protein [Chloroflexia bacterium]|nr:R3H domain-containing nucleic acid-binding protein [Chloroflexia bacterium]
MRNGGEHVVTDDLDALLSALPKEIVDPLRALNNRVNLIEIVMDLGRKPEARYRGSEATLTETEISRAELDYVVNHIGEFGGDNRAGIERTLHRISCIRNRRGDVVGLTCRIGRAVYGTISIIKDLVETGRSILLVGPPGVGKTTILRECARVLADELGKRVVVVDTSNEIAGDGDIPHHSIGRARRMQVPVPERQHAVMIEAVENHMPEVIIIDEIGTELEAQAARTIAERGVQLVGTAHGTSLENLMLNPTLSDLVGGIQSVTLSDEEARRRGTQKSVLERKAPPTFDIIVELLDRERVAVHRDVAETVDSLLRGDIIPPEIRTRRADGTIHTEIAHTPPPTSRPGSANMNMGGRGGGRGGQGRRDYGYDQGTLPSAPRRQQMPESPAMRRDRPFGGNGNGNGNRSREVGTGGQSRPFDQAGPGPLPAQSPAPTQMYEQRDPWIAQQEERERTQTTRIGPNPMSVAQSVSPGKPLRIYPFGVGRNRLETAIKNLRVPATMVREIGDSDLVLTLKNYYRKSPQSLRGAESAGVPVFVLRSNTQTQIESALAGVFNVEPVGDPTTNALVETEDAISSVMETARAVDLAPQTAEIRKLQHKLAERYNLASVSRGKEPFRRVRIFRQN